MKVLALAFVVLTAMVVVSGCVSTPTDTGTQTVEEQQQEAFDTVDSEIIDETSVEENVVEIGEMI